MQMIRPLPEPLYGATHLRLDEVVFSLTCDAAAVRVTLGAEAEGGGFAESALLRPISVQFEGTEFLALTDALDSAPLLSALEARGWGIPGATATLDAEASPEGVG